MAGYPVHRTAMARWAHGTDVRPGARLGHVIRYIGPGGVAAKVLSAGKPDATAIQATVDTLLQPRLATLANCN